MKVYELLADPSRWTTNYFAQNKEGFATMPDDKRAVCWCLEGAIMKCYDDSGPILSKTYDHCMKKYDKTTPEFNDSASHEEVVALAKELDI